MTKAYRGVKSHAYIHIDANARGDTLSLSMHCIIVFARFFRHSFNAFEPHKSEIIVCVCVIVVKHTRTHFTMPAFLTAML